MRTILQNNLKKVTQDLDKVGKDITALQKQQLLMEGGRQTIQQIMAFEKLRDKGCQI